MGYREFSDFVPDEGADPETEPLALLSGVPLLLKDPEPLLL